MIVFVVERKSEWAFGIMIPECNRFFGKGSRVFFIPSYSNNEQLRCGGLVWFVEETDCVNNEGLAQGNEEGWEG